MPFNFTFEGPETKRRREMEDQLAAEQLENTRMRNKAIERDLYPERTAVETTERLFATTNPVERQALMNKLAQTTGTRTIPGTSMSVPAGLPEDAEVQILDNAVNRAAALQRFADSEPDPVRRTILQEVATAGRKGIVAKGKELTVADTAFELNAAAFMRMADQLEGAVMQYGNFESMNPQGSALIRQLPYEMAIAYAKIVDPSSVAREGEVAAAQKYLVPMSRTPIPDAFGMTPDSPLSVKNETTLQAIRNMKDGIRARILSYERTSGRNLDIGNPTGGTPATGTATTPAATGQPQPSGQGTFQYDPRSRRLIPGR